MADKSSWSCRIDTSKGDRDVSIDLINFSCRWTNGDEVVNSLSIQTTNGRYGQKQQHIPFTHGFHFCFRDFSEKQDWELVSHAGYW
jgi:hypothetical protein